MVQAAHMHFVGVDLAWGEKKPTGLAVLDADGALVHVQAAGNDDEIVEALGSWVDGPCLVAIDAPLVVTNPTGSRPAERALSKDFRRFEAGTHPSNTGKPEFAHGSRGGRLVARLGLDMDPRSGRDRRAIEVYPHPATVVLFGLPRTLKYKDKPGRSFDQLQSELLVLMGFVEGVVRTNGAWSALRRAVETATKKAELRVVEDQVDAVVCAYVALFAHRWPERTTTYGNPEAYLTEGYIVTPSLRTEDLARQEVVQTAISEYAARHAELREAGAAFVELVESVLDEAGINYLSVTGRAKSVSSFAAKAARTVEGVPVFVDPLRDITDTIGIRVITYVHSDVAAVADLLGDQVVIHDDRDMGQETASQGRFGYASRHLLIGLDATREGEPAYAALAGLRAQVQIRTVLQHAWAEFEHDIRYKGTIPDEHVPDFDRRFTLAAGLLELADREFSTIRDRLTTQVAASEPSAPEDDDPRIDPRELAAFLAGQYADAGWSRTDHYTWISGLLLELGVTSLVELADVLRTVEALDLTARMDYRYPPGAVRRLDDALLAAFRERYVGLHGNAHRAAALTGRLEKLALDRPTS
ncbi:GTP pyrophosphokinase [Nocardioides sp. LS1]|nr:GTP pyrophosphokinase [Nocardioides sp. LS1]